MTVTITAWHDQNPSIPGSGHAHGFRTPFAARIAVLFALAAIALDDYLVGDEPVSTPEPEDDHGWRPGEVATISAAIRTAGIYDRIDNVDAYLGHVLRAIQLHPEPASGAPTESDSGAILRAALVAYSDLDGDGVANVAEISDEEVAAFHAAVLPMFDAPAAPAPG